MTNLEKLIETLQNAPIENTACFIAWNFEYACRWCAFNNLKGEKCAKDCTYEICQDGIKKWLESEVNE